MSYFYWGGNTNLDYLVKPFYKNLNCKRDFKSGTGRNVLYLGMANDILSPFCLIPDIENIYVIDLFDTFISPENSRNSQRKAIIDVLVKMGFDIINENLLASHKTDHSYYIKFFKDRIKFATPEESIEDYQYEIDLMKNEQSMEGEWTIMFKHPKQTVIRQLKIFSSNFYTKWDDQITEITDVLGMGAITTDSILENKYRKILINRMLNERTKNQFTLYISGMPNRILLRQFKFESTNEICEDYVDYVTIDKNISGKDIVDYCHNLEMYD